MMVAYGKSGLVFSLPSKRLAAVSTNCRCSSGPFQFLLLVGNLFRILLITAKTQVEVVGWQEVNLPIFMWA